MTYPIDMTMKPDVSAHFDEATNTISYIVKDRSLCWTGSSKPTSTPIT